MNAIVKSNQDCRKSMNQEQMKKNTMQCCVFNRAFVGACQCDRTPFLSRPEFL